MKELEKLKETKKTQLNMTVKSERTYFELSQNQSKSRSHDRTTNRHCLGNTIVTDYLGMTSQDFTNIWQADKPHCQLLKAMKVAYRLMKEELLFLRLMKIMEGCDNKCTKSFRRDC